MQHNSLAEVREAVWQGATSNLRARTLSFRGTGSDFRCIYHTSDGRKCNFGYAISEELYDPAWDSGAGSHWKEILKVISEQTLEDSHSADDADLIHRLITAHDNAAGAINDHVTKYKAWAEYIRELRRLMLQYPDILPAPPDWAIISNYDFEPVQ